MTITTPREPESAMHDWACRQLQQPAGATWSAARADFLRQLEAADFCPAAQLDYAQRVLADGGATCPANFGWQLAQLDLEADGRREVEQLAAGWFSLEAPERRERWRRLFAAAARFPNLCVRLEALEAGLDIDLEELTGPHRQLAGMIAELFVMRVGPRAVRRRELLAELEESIEIWDSTAADLKENHPAIAALEPVLVEAILSRKHHAGRVRSAKKMFRRSAKAAAATSNSNHWPWLIAAIVVFQLVRLGLQSSSSPPPPPPPRFVNPQPFPHLHDKESNEIQKILSGKWRFKDGKLVPSDEAPAPFPGRFEMRDGKVVIVPKPPPTPDAKTIPAPDPAKK